MKGSAKVRVQGAANPILRRLLAENGFDEPRPVAHHNGGDDIMALPALYAVGFGELGKHGSLIHPSWVRASGPVS